MKSTSPFGLRLRIALFTGMVLFAVIALTDVTLATLLQTHVHTIGDEAEASCDVDTHQALDTFAKRLRKPVFVYLCTGAALSLLLIWLVVHYVVVRPLSQITRAVERVTDGDQNVHVPIQGAGELVSLSLRFNQMTRTIAAQRAELLAQIDKIETANRERLAAQDRLVGASRLASLGTLAAGVAHEIGNPVAGVLGLLEALESEEEPARVAHYHALIRKETERVDRTISELLNYARPERNLDAPAEGTTLTDAADNVLQLLKAQSRFDGVVFSISIAASLPPVRMCTEDFTQLLVNLLLNAAEAMEGRGHIEVAAQRDADTPQQIVLSVADDGPGIPAEDQPHVFDPFFSRRRSSGGTGLGLAICHRICERNGGRIQLDETHAPGARFVVLLPVVSREGANA